jgi:hypothetical protein
MKCPFCQKKVTATARYCPFCGKKMDVTFDEIRRGMVDEDRSEKLQEKVRESRRVLAIAVFLFLVSLIIYIAIPSPRLPDAVPVYRVEVPALDDVYVEKVDLPLFEIPQ